MSKFHELTEKVWLANGWTENGEFKEKMDSIIRSWIEEKAKEIKKLCIGYDHNVDSILGFTSQFDKFMEFPHSWDMNKNEWSCECCKPKEEKKSDGEWPCGHIKAKDGKHELLYYADNASSLSYTGADERWNFCPICSAPRPVAKSLAEKFRDHFRDQDSGDASAIEHKYSTLAKIAEEHFRKENK